MYLIVCMYTRVIAIVYMCFILFIPYNFNLKHKLHPCEVKSRTPRTNNTTFIHHHLIPTFSPHNSTLKTTSKYSPKMLLKPPPKTFLNHLNHHHLVVFRHQNLHVRKQKTEHNKAKILLGRFSP